MVRASASQTGVASMTEIYTQQLARPSAAASPIFIFVYLLVCECASSTYIESNANVKVNFLPGSFLSIFFRIDLSMVNRKQYFFRCFVYIQNPDRKPFVFVPLTVISGTNVFGRPSFALPLIQKCCPIQWRKKGKADREKKNTNARYNWMKMSLYPVFSCVRCTHENGLWII